MMGMHDANTFSLLSAWRQISGPTPAGSPMVIPMRGLLIWMAEATGISTGCQQIRNPEFKIDCLRGDIGFWFPAYFGHGPVESALEGKVEQWKRREQRFDR